MADEVDVSVPSSSPLLLSPTSTVTSDNIPALPIAAIFFQSSSDPSISTIPTPSSPSTLDNPQSSPKAHSPPRPALIPIPIIAGAAGGVVLLILAIVIWYCLRRRRQNRRVSNPELSYDSRKESPQYDNNDNNNNKKEGDGRVSIDSFPGLSPVQRPRDLECGLPSSNNNSSSNNYTYNPRPSFSSARSPPPPPVVSHSISIPMRETSLYPVPEGSHEQQTNHIHIDMTMPIAVSDEIKPVVQPQQQEKVVQDASKSLACIQPATIVTAAATATTEHKPRASTDTIMPTPVLRRPKLTVRRSTDSFIQGGRARISMCLPPPPPPPTIPPPAIPITNPGDSGYGGGRGRVSTESSSCRSSIYSTHPTSGRRTRSSTESSRVAYSRRSVSMDASSAGDGRRLSRRVILPPTIPPPPVPLPPPPPIPVPMPTPSPTSSVPSTPINLQQFQPQQHVAPPPRRRHQRNPSQILNTSLFDSSDRSAISPPLSPLTIQIPRPSSRSFQSLLTINTQLTAENVQQYLQQQPAPLEIAKPDSPTDSVAAPSPRTTSLYHSPRSRRKSTSQIETHRIMIPPSAANMTSPTSSTFSPPVPPLPPVPAMPTLFESYLPSSPSSTTSSSQSCISMKRPSLSHQMSSSSLDSTRTDNTASTSVNARIDIHHYHHHYHDNNDNGADDSHRYQYHHNYHDGRHSAEPKKRQQQKQQRRRSMSLPSSPSSPSSSNQVESKEDFASAIAGTSNTTTAIATKDQELQAIIADAIAIAAAKTAAIESARQNTFHRQMQVKYQQHQQQQQQQQRRLYPSQMDPWRSTTPSPSTLDSSRPESPL